MIYFDSADLYIEQCQTLQDKITAIDNIQSALLTSALQAASKGAIDEYMLNDGQTIIKTKYRNAEDIMKSYRAFESIKQMFVQRINGRVTRLMDSKNFTRNANYR